MGFLGTPIQIGRTIKNAARLRTIVGTFVKYGFQDVANKIKIGKFALARVGRNDYLHLSRPERLRRAFEELGPTFVKLGQLLATRPDLVPASISEEFRKLHDQVQPVEFEKLRLTLNKHFKDVLGNPAATFSDVFLDFDEIPIASASIAQVHQAHLKDGTPVVVKIQRPGIRKVIEDDIHILYTLAEMIEKRFKEYRIFNPTGIVDELFKTLQLETNFVVEANNIRKFTKNFATDPDVKIPAVYMEFLGEEVLVMEKIEGIPLSKFDRIKYPDISPEETVRKGIRLFFDQVFKHGLFHGDLHSGNLFLMSDNRLGLIDFGVVGRINSRTQKAIASMFVALFQEDYDRLALEYVDLAPFNESTNGEAFSRDLRGLLAPYFGLTMKNVNLGRLLMDSTSIAARHRVALPPDLILFFKSIVTVEGMGRQLIEDFDLLPYALEFAEDLIRVRYEPQRMLEEFAGFSKDSLSLLYSAPRQVQQILRKVNHPGTALRIEIKRLEALRHSFVRSGNLIFLGLITGSLIVSGTLLYNAQPQAVFAGLPIGSLIFYSIAGVLGLAAFYSYIKRS